MTKEEYLEKLNKLKTKRNSLFKKITKCDKDVKKLNEEYIKSIINLKEGDRLIGITPDGNKEYLKIHHILFIKDKDTNVVQLMCKRLNERWKMPRRFDWCKEGEIDLFEYNNYKMPPHWEWTKIEE